VPTYGTSMPRPVLLYGEQWALSVRIGATKIGQVVEDRLLTEQDAESIASRLHDTPAIVIMSRGDYDTMFHPGGRQSDSLFAGFWAKSFTKTLASYLSTVHYTWLPYSHIAESGRWGRSIGSEIVSRYHRVAEFGDFIVLEA
jgi:hypothetical protein